MSISWKAVERALFDWVDRQLPDIDPESQIIWKNQNIPRPKYPYIALLRSPLLRQGAKDETRTSTDLAQEQGKEVLLETVAQREFTLTVEALVDEENGGHDPDCDANAILNLLQDSLSEEDVVVEFVEANLAVIEEMPITDLSQVYNGVFVSRASMDVRIRVAYTREQRTGYIESVRVTSVPNDPADPNDVTGFDLTVSGS